MTGSEPIVGLVLVLAVFLAFVWWKQHQLVRHALELMASRSYSEWAKGQDTLAKVEAKKQGEKVEPSQGYNEVFDR
jgi:hypothetical protein